jgi:hypothetical protein
MDGAGWLESKELKVSENIDIFFTTGSLRLEKA